ncbi:O-antigen ligase family protein [Priestia aryabhattai]|uniref:O-antigen ligase family protein n=1 Tax=Priestia aryabhattai TaxID=412384 RepID=UPI002380C13D|nr:O-antigen ligase family protein [Priestia aryabhattai]WDW10071.1 O-antigen ligase family protein [Priestia aryabhattai]
MNIFLKKPNLLICVSLVLYSLLINTDYLYGSLAKYVYLYNIRNILTGSLLICLISFWMLNRKQVVFNKTMFYFIVLIFYMFFSLGVISPARGYGGEKFNGFLVSIFLGYMPFLFAYSYGTIIKFYKYLFVVNVLILALMFLINDLSTYTTDTRLIVGEINPIWLGRFFGELIILVSFFVKKEKFWFFKVLIISLLSIGILFTGSKGPFLSILIGAFIANISNLTENISITRALRFITKVTILAIGLILGVKFILLKLFSINYLANRFIVGNSETSYGDYSRSHLYKHALDYFYHSPIWGNGLGSFGYMLNGFDIRDYPHNIFLETLSELGLIGFIILIIPIYISVRRFYIYSKFDSRGYIKLTMCLFIYYLVNSLVSGDLGFSNSRLFLFIGILNYLFVLHTGKYPLSRNKDI